MISHGLKCKMCNGKMTAPKPVLEGPKAGQMRTFCTKCGHIQYLAATDAPQPPPQPEGPQH